MVSSISYQLGKNRLVTGFGMHRRTTSGRGVVRRTVGAIAGPALTYIANKIADVISGTGVHRRKSVHHGASWKITGSGTVRKPRRHLTTRRAGAGKRKTAHRKPRSTLVSHRRRIMF